MWQRNGTVGAKASTTNSAALLAMKLAIMTFNLSAELADQISELWIDVGPPPDTVESHFTWVY